MTPEIFATNMFPALPDTAVATTALQHALHALYRQGYADGVAAMQARCDSLEAVAKATSCLVPEWPYLLVCALALMVLWQVLYCERSAQ